MNMKDIVLIIIASAILFGCSTTKTIQSGNAVFKMPKEFVPINFVNKDDAVNKLDMLLKQQYIARGTSLYAGINEERLERGASRHYYYNTITSVCLKIQELSNNSWPPAENKYMCIIEFSSSIIGNKDRIRFKDKKMAEVAFSALIYLIDNSAK